MHSSIIQNALNEFLISAVRYKLRELKGQFLRGEITSEGYNIQVEKICQVPKDYKTP